MSQDTGKVKHGDEVDLEVEFRHHLGEGHKDEAESNDDTGRIREEVEYRIRCRRNDEFLLREVVSDRRFSILVRACRLVKVLPLSHLVEMVLFRLAKRSAPEVLPV